MRSTAVRRASKGAGSGYEGILVVRRLWPVGPFVLPAQTSSFCRSGPCSRRSAYCGRGGGTAPLLASNAPRTTATNGGPRLVPVEASRWRGPDVPTMIPYEEPAGKAALDHLTNRQANASPCEDRSPGATLIDTLTFTGPISGHRAASTRRRQDVDANGVVEEWFVSADVELPDGRLRIEVCRGDRAKMRARVERSLPTMAFGHNRVAVSVEQAWALVIRLYEQADEFVDWQVPPSDLSVQRLDLARDFRRIEHLDRLLTGLARLRVTRSGAPHLYFREGGVQTLARGVAGTWVAQLYDKHAQLRHLAVTTRHDPTRAALLHEVADAAYGQVRFEAQLRRPALRRHGVMLMTDLTEHGLLNLREKYFRRARYDTPVGGAPHLDAVMTHLARTGDPNYRYWGAVVAMMKAEALGLRQPASSSASLAKYRALAKEWNISAADMDHVAGPAVMLDYTSGTLRAA